MTLVEFIAPLKKSSTRDKALAVLYYQHRYAGEESLTVEQLRTQLQNARVPKAAKINVADVLSKGGHYVDSPGSQGPRRLWRLTTSGEEHVRTLLKLPSAEPEVEHNVATLEQLASRITDAQIRDYVEEAVKCLRVGALRAAIVFLWTGAVRTLQTLALAKGRQNLNAALIKHDPKARNVGKIDDFAYIKDAVLLMALFDLGIIDKGQRGTLEENLDLRNRCGHPTKYKPGVSKASSFIEDLVGIAF